MRRMKRAMAMLLAVATLFSNCSISAFATTVETTEGREEQEILTYEDYQYTVLSDNTISICGYTGIPENDGEGTYLEIPSSINGTEVTQIAEEAFAYNSVIDAVMIPDSVTSVGNAAFYHCADLKAIAFYGAAPAFGITVVEGSHSLEKVFALDDSDITMFCSLLVNDLGEDGAKSVEILEYENPDTLKSAYHEYVESLGTELQSVNIQEETTTPESGVEVSDSENIEDTVVDVEDGDFDNVIAEGACGDSLTWVLNDSGVLNISGTGAMTDYSQETPAPWYSYVDSITSLVLDDGITYISKDAFYGCYNLSGNLVIPDGVKEIDRNAFHFCSGLTGELVIPDSVTIIGYGAFGNCVGLTGNLVIPDSVTSIGDYAFSDCRKITGDLVIPDNIISLGKRVFEGMSSITSVTFGENFSSYGDNSFFGCSGVKEVTFKNPTVAAISDNDHNPFNSMSELETVYVPIEACNDYISAYQSYLPSTAKIESMEVTEDFQIENGVLVAYLGNGGEVVIPDGVTEIGPSAFADCTTLTGVTMPASLTEISDYAFSGCTNLTGELVIPDSVTSIGYGAFENCSNLTGDLVIPDSVTSIGFRAFYDCTGLNGRLMLPASLTGIGSCAFGGCTNLTGELVIPNSVTRIGAWAFENMESITSVTFGENFSIYGYNTFLDCSGVKEVTFKNPTVAVISDNDYNPFISMSKLETVYVPASAYSDYATAYQYYLPSTARLKIMGVTEDFLIENGVLVAYLGNGGEVVIPDGVTEIGSSAFQNCTTLTNVTMPAGVVSIGSYAFSGCTGLTSLILPENLTTIGSNAFYKCTGLTGSLVIPDSVTCIGNSAFQGCTGFYGTLTLSASLIEIGDEAFQFCKGLTGGLEIPEKVTRIGDDAFADCTGFSGELVIPNSVTSIGENAFADCGLTGDLIIPDSVTSISFRAFWSCRGFHGTLTLPATLTEIGDMAFLACHNLTGKLIIPDSVTKIGEYAFGDCYGLSGELVIPNSVTSIGDYAFYGCRGFYGRLTLPTSLTEVGHNAFYNCSNITGELVIPDSITSLGNHAFENMSSITSVTFGENFSSYGYDTFLGCSGVKEVTFKNPAVAEISDNDHNPFISMSELETVYVPIEAYNDYISAYQSYLPSTAKIESMEVTKDFQIENGVLVAYLGNGGEVVIPDGVTEIGPSAFADCTTLTGVTMPAGVVSIGSNAFSGCTNLRGELAIPDSVTSIGDYAFQYCSSLTGNLVIPDSVTSIGDGAFRDCTGFNGTLTLSASLTGLGDYAFSGCNNITSVIFGEKFTSHGRDSFNGCRGVKEVTFKNPNMVTISDSAHNPFIFMSELETVYVPASAYSDYASVYPYYFPGKVRLNIMGATEDFWIDDDVLIAYLGNGGEVVIPDGVTEIGSSAFRNCTTLTKVTMPSSVVSIGSDAFRNCTGLTSAKLPENLTTIGSFSFYDCTRLTGNLVIPDTVTNIGDYAFSDCGGLTGELVIPDNMTNIGDYAFRGCSGLTGELVIPNSVTSIGDYAFYGCRGFYGRLTLPEFLTEIRPGTFAGCSGLTSELVIPDNVTNIGGAAFSGCSGLTGELVIPDSVTSIGDYAFYGCKNITSVIFGENIISHGYNTFWVCNGVKKVTFKNFTVAAISDNDHNPFKSMSELETIYVPANSYDEYVSAYSGYVSDTVVFIRDYLNEKVTNLTASKVYSQTVSLIWDAHASDRVVGYTIERDGEVVGTTTDCTFTERGLTTGTTYTYSVYGYAENGMVTETAEITVTPSAPRITDIKTDNNLNKVGVKNTIYIYVSDDNNLEDFDNQAATVDLYYLDGTKRVLIGKPVRNAALDSELGAVYTVEWDISAVEGGEYELLFCIMDIDGAAAEYNKTVTVDHSVPKQIVGVTAIGDINVIHLTWAISSEVDTNTYQIYRRAEDDEEFRLTAQINDRNKLTYNDSHVENDRTYYYYVVGVNEFGQKSEASKIVSAMPSSDAEAPTVTKLTPVNASCLTGTVTISLTAEDNVSVTKAALYYSTDNGENWTLIKEFNTDNFSTSFDTTALADGVIHIKGVAYDAAGNESSALTYVYSIDNTGPEQVTGLSYESTDVTVTLSWNDVADKDIRYYRVEQENSDGSYSKVTDIYTTLGANIYNLTPDNNYVYRVVGYDIQGNRGIPSESITAATLSDTTAPVVTRIRPTSGYYSDSIGLSINAEDEYNVASIIIQTSTDGITWSDVYAKTYTDVRAFRTLSYTLTLDSYAEGYLFVRAIAADKAGNESDSGKTAPYVQYMVDKTAPAVPENVTAIGNSGYIEVAWVQGSEADLNKYSIYRAESETGTYTLLKSGIAAINYIDRNVEEGIVYYYKVMVNDIAGNTSDFSAVVSAKMIKDAKNPEIISVYPENGESIGYGYKTVSVLATDNNALESILIEYSKDGNTYTDLYKQTGMNTHNKTITAVIPVSEFSDGAEVYIRASATDKSGNKSEPVVKKYVVDAVAPVVSSAGAEYRDESVYVSWTGRAESDLIGYRIYRKSGAAGSYSLISQRQVVEGQTEYSCYDYNLSITKTTYIYKIEAVDKQGNTSSIVTSEVKIPDRSAPKPVITCDPTQEVGVEYYIDATSSTDNSKIVSYLFDFGDGTTSTDRKPVHTYSETGNYTITLTVIDDDGNQAACTKEITVRERGLLGTAKIRIVDENGIVIAGAPVYFNLGRENQIIKTTDRNGYVTFTAEVGKHTVGCVIADNEWLPAKKDIIITSGEETSVSMTLVHHVMIEGQFEITRMTFEEIVAAGIDVSDPENQYMVKVNVTLTYSADTVETSFLYNETTGKTIAKPTIVTTPDGEKRQIIPVVLSTNSDDYTFSSEASIAYLDIPVGVASLKEFFNVNLHIINNASSKFSMLDNVIKLNVPDGLTLMETYISENSSTVTIAEIKGQTTETITWILRGDEIGKYYLTADYSGILSEFDEPIYTEFISTEPIEVYGMSNLKLTMEIPEELDHGTFYYNVSLGNEGKVDVYRPDIKTGDTLIETQLFDAVGADVTDIISLDAEKIDEFGLATSIEGTLDVLPAGYRITRHYMCTEQTSYTELEQKLEDYAYEMRNTYGLEVEFVTRPVSYFKSNLSANINAADKADLTFTTNQSAFDYLMTNENYIYWSMYASTGEVSTALTTNGKEQLWELLKFAAGDGDFKALFGADDEELIQAIILDAMEISVESDDYSKYYAICDWTTLVENWVEDEGHGEWINIATKWIKGKLENATEETIAKKVDDFGKSLPHTFELIATEYRWEAYKAIYEGEYLDFDNFVVGKWQAVIEEYYFESTEIYTETDGSKMLHELFSAEGFSAIWKAIGISLKTAKKIVSACEKTSTDISLYFSAQSNLDSCNLFLDTLSEYMRCDSGDADKVKKAAVKIKEKMNELDVVGSLAENLLDEAFWMSVDFAKDAAIKKLNLSPSGFVLAVKAALKMTVYIGNNVFHVDDRHDIADNIRFVSCMTIALRYGIWDAQASYLSNKTNDTAKRYMQLISYLLNIREIGESQVAQFGITYEVLPGVFDSKDLFYAVRDMSGAAGTTSWIEWRDFVEDKISMLRVQLLKNPLVTDVSGLTAPIVTFNYATGKTAQTFSSDYEYSLDGGNTWTVCSGTAISVPAQNYSMELQVRRVDYSDSNEKMTGSIMIYGPSALSGSGIRVLKTKDGYRVENLDHDRRYEVTFAQEPISYKYGDSLNITIPDGSYSYDYATSSQYGYVYIRSVADARSYASYVFMPEIYPMYKLTVEKEGQGTITGTGSYEYGEEVTLMAASAEDYKFEGWYENDALVSTEASLTLRMVEDRAFTAKFTEIAAEWNLDTVTGTVTGIPEGTAVEDVIANFETGDVTVTVTTPDGMEADDVGTGYLLNVGDESYTIVIQGDVNGDAAVDIFDVISIMDHLNGDAELTGANLQAALSDIYEAEPTVFDAISIVDQINDTQKQQGGLR